MNEYLLFYVVTMLFVCVITGLLLVYRYYLGNRLTEQANKLKSQIANIRRDYPTIGTNPQQMVEGSLGDIGIEGIIDSLGLPKIVTPFIKGFLSNPDNINKIMELLKSKGINLNVDKSKGEEIPLL